jgi:NitT/TauT family transport system ATP-binding protein
VATLAAIRQLSLSYGGAAGTPVLENLTLDIAPGEFVVVVGSSGVGKSTLLRVLAGLAQPTSGEVKLDLPVDRARLPVALVFQEARLLPWRTVRGNVSFGLEALELSREERQRRIDEALALVRLSEFTKRWPWQLSGGQRQRVGLARALAVKPSLLLMDEPFAALDAITRATLQDELIRVWRETGVSILFVTHDIQEALYLAGRVVVLNGKPARVTRDVRIDSPWPRNRTEVASSPEAASIRTGLAEQLADGAGI